ncbi:hypothetical protein BH09VER1_BH09VER1_23250 [soil metagenome]
MKPFGIFLIVLGIACFFMPFVFPAPKTIPKPVQPGFETVVQTEALSIFPLMGISAVATGGALVLASFITGSKGRPSR